MIIAASTCGRRFAIRHSSLAIVGCLLLALTVGLTAGPARPPATVGLVKGLSVAEELSGGTPRGVIFPIRVRAEKGTGGLRSNAPMDPIGIRSVYDAFAYLRRLARAPGVPLPADFPSGYNYVFTFPEPTYIISGDSAGVAMAVAIYSAVTGVPVLDDVSITGAISPDGSVRSVASIEMKLEGVLRSHVGTMILPAENWATTSAEAAAIAVRAYPRTRLVFVRNMDEVFFHAFGPYGPQREAYAQYAQSLTDAVEVARKKDFETSLRMLDGLSRRMPGDTTASYWASVVGGSYTEDLVRTGQRALWEGRMEDARWCAERGLHFSPDDPAALLLLDDAKRGSRQPSFLGTPAVWPPWGKILPSIRPMASDIPTGGEPTAVLVPILVDRLPLPEVPSADPAAWAGPMREMWERTVPSVIPLKLVREPQAGGTGSLLPVLVTTRVASNPCHPPASKLIAAALMDDQRFALLLAVPDSNGRVDLEEETWVLGPEGFSRRGTEDRLGVVWWPPSWSEGQPANMAPAGSPAGKWRAPARTPLGRPGAEAPTCPGGSPAAVGSGTMADLWRWGAGTTNFSGCADDMVCDLDEAGDSSREVRHDEVRGDEGAPLGLPNELNGRPAKTFDGVVGPLNNPHVLEAARAISLSADPLRGREQFALRCASCHASDRETVAFAKASEWVSTGNGGGARSPRPDRGGPLDGIAWYLEGSMEHLEETLTRGSMAAYAGAGNVPDLIAYLRCASPIPGYLIGAPTRSRADVRAVGIFEPLRLPEAAGAPAAMFFLLGEEAPQAEGTWCLVFVRDRATGHGDDLPFIAPRTYHLRIRVRDGGTRAEYLSAPIALTFQ